MIKSILFLNLIELRNSIKKEIKGSLVCKVLSTIFSLLLCVASLNAQPWVMFSDMDDTYLYDQASGQVYIRVKNGGKNYEDTFVKMGLRDSIKDKVDKTQAQNTTIKKDALSEQQKLLQQAQELQRNIQGALLGGD